MPPAAVAAADADNNLANFCSKSQAEADANWELGTSHWELGTGHMAWHGVLCWCGVAWCDVVWRISWRNKNKTID